jgi:hypothetical protein
VHLAFLTSDSSRILVIETELFLYTATTVIEQVDFQCLRLDRPIIKKVAIDLRDKEVVSGMMSKRKVDLGVTVIFGSSSRVRAVRNACWQSIDIRIVPSRSKVAGHVDEVEIG